MNDISPFYSFSDDRLVYLRIAVAVGSDYRLKNRELKVLERIVGLSSACFAVFAGEYSDINAFLHKARP